MQKTRHVGFLLVPGFSMMGFGAAIDPLRVANRLTGQQLYSWSILSTDGMPVKASVDLEITPHFSFTQAPAEFDLVVVCAGFVNTHHFNSRKLHDWLRKLARRGCIMGGISTGAEILANAGLLDEVRCTVHWENDESFRENHPKAILTGGIFEMDRNCITAAGGTASLDMMLKWISWSNDEYLASAIAEQLIHDHLRNPGEFQRSVEIRLAQRRSPKLARAMELMMSNIENTLSSIEIAKRVGLSMRQLERLFAKYRGKTMHRYYLDIRLQKSRYLVFHTAMPLHQISIATGFSSQAHFSRSYKCYFCETPSRDRSIGEPAVSEQIPAGL